jgi:exopolysaccharide biosynthesis polyprenyl glycosylphosphotransferase
LRDCRQRPAWATCARWRPFIRERGVQEVYITLPLGSQPRIVDLMEQVQGTTASVFFVPDVFGISIIQGRLQDMNGVPVVGLCETPFTGTNRLVKRLSDIVLASAILLITAPVLLAIAVGVKLSSPGPVLFRQRRNGLDGEEIVVYKFRSMLAQEDGPVVRQAIKDDPRVTGFGAFLRRTSLDELPQFINVLQGRMSIVGPRPHAVAHNEMYRRIIKAYMVRHKVKPGITARPASVVGVDDFSNSSPEVLRRLQELSGQRAGVRARQTCATKPRCRVSLNATASMPPCTSPPSRRWVNPPPSRWTITATTWAACSACAA